MDLVKKSKAVLTLYQHQNGAFPACPAFPVYHYCWLRDGTFCAYALDLAGEHQSSGSFYGWVNETVSKHLAKLDFLPEKLNSGNVHDNDFLHARYTLTGEEGKEPWGNFQLDGYGTFLWGLVEHCKLSGSEEILNNWSWVIRKTALYLQEYWLIQCLDCWEEKKGIHPSTLAAVYGGLKALHILRPQWVDERILQNIRFYTFSQFSNGFYFTKDSHNDGVDANLLMLGVPFGLVELDNPLLTNTIKKMEEDLKPAGLYRYLGDTYYGGGEWVLLTAWLGWYYALVGKRTEAEEILAWVEAQADPFGLLPEQTNHHLQSEKDYYAWVRRWGEVAKPLLWSHAMHLILVYSLNRLR